MLISVFKGQGRMSEGRGLSAWLLGGGLCCAIVLEMNEACAFPPATDAGTSSQIIAVTPQIDMVRLAIQERLSPRGRAQGLALMPGVRGMAAGSAQDARAAWAGYSSGDSELQRADVQTSIDVASISVGYDLMFGRSLTAGVSLSSERSRMRYWFSLPTARGEGRMMSVAPYLGWSLAPGLTADLILGIARGDTDHSMGPGFEGSQSIHRNYIAASLNRQWQGAGFEWAVRAGYLGTRQRNQAYSLGASAVDASDSDTQRAQFGLQSTYMGGTFLPVVGATYSYDLSQPTGSSVGRSGTMLSAGMLWIAHPGITLGASYQREVGRSESRNDLLLLNLMARF
jgi:hypothetical protein